jgi:hypothetical protein
MTPGGHPIDAEAESLAQQLGVTRRAVKRMGMYEARRLMKLDPASRALVLTRKQSRKKMFLGVGLVHEPLPVMRNKPGQYDERDVAK